MPTLVITTQALIGSEIIYEVPVRLKLPDLPLPPIPGLGPDFALLAKLIQDFLKFIENLPAALQLNIPALPCPLDLRDIPLPFNLGFLKIPELISIPFPPALGIPANIATLIADIKRFIDNIPQIPTFNFPALPCPMDLNAAEILPTVVLPKIPALPLGAFPPPLPLPDGFVSLLADFKKFLDNLPEIGVVEIPTLPCPVNLGYPSINIESSIEP